jgi:hypothetical protein
MRSETRPALPSSSIGAASLCRPDGASVQGGLFYKDSTPTELAEEVRSSKANLSAAEKLINDCGYHRRDEELADAKTAILGT